MRTRLLVTAYLAVFSLSATAQQTFPVNGTTDPRHTLFAFRNVRIHTDAKNVIDSAVMLVRDGIIQEIGRGISIPGEAIVYDLQGKNIYPSFVEIFSEYGLPEVRKQTPGDVAPQFLSNTKGAYGWNQAIRSEYDAYRNFNSDSKKADDLRKNGFGVVNSICRDGIVRGTSVIALLGDGKENEWILKDRATANYSFDKGSSSQDYPSSLMGSIALIRQTYYDAKWYKDGGYNKEYNISLDAFNKLQNLPQLFEAGDKQDELRVAKIGEEFNVKYIIKASGDEFERLDEIRKTGASLILPLTFPDAYDLTDPYDALNVSLHMMKQWELMPGNPATVQKAGIKFALTAVDLKSKADFWKNIRKAMDNGLSEEDALRALTETPAEMLGISAQVGALRKGMIADFLVTSKNIFEKDNVIFENWVKGTRYKYADADQKDPRGNYSLRVGTMPALRMKVSGELMNPDAVIFEDSTSTKISLSRQATIVAIQFELKKQEPKGNYRLSGTSDGIDSRDWKGNALLPDGSWATWTAHYDSAWIAPVPKDSGKKDLSPPGPVLFPDLAYGWKELPVASTVLIRNATVWTNEREGILQNADVLISGGKIKQVGKNISAPAGAEVVDGTGKHLTSGIIDEHSHIAVSGDVNEATQSSSAEVRIGDVIDGDDVQVYRQLSGGVTCSHILHGSANAIGGQTQLIKLRWGEAPEKMKFQGWPGFIKFALGENVKQSNWGDRQVTRFPQTRMGVEQVYMDYFTRAKEYAQEMKKFNALKPAELKGKIPPRRNIELDALEEIIEGKRFITCHSYVQSEINMLMHVADTFGFKVNTFTHILEGYKVADKMKQHGVLGASTFSDWWAYKFEVYEAIPYNGAIMHKMGLNVSYNSDDPEMARRLNQEAAKAIMYGGISEEDAWKFVTLNPAKMLHIDNQVGSVKVGKDADLVLWNENPLSIYAKPLQTYVDGIRYFDVDRDQQLRNEIKKERSRLMQKMVDAKLRGDVVQKPKFKSYIIKHCIGEEEQISY